MLIEYLNKLATALFVVQFHGQPQRYQETVFPVTGNIIGTNIVKITPITPIEANIWQSVQF